MPMRRERNAKQPRTRKAPPVKTSSPDDFIEDYFLDAFYARHLNRGDSAA